MAANSRRNGLSLLNDSPSNNSKRIRRRHGMMALSAAAGAVGLFSLSAKPAHAADFYYDYTPNAVNLNSPPPTFSTNLGAASNWYTLSGTVYTASTQTPGSGDIAHFDSNLTDIASPKTFTLATATVTTWGGLTDSSAALTNSYSPAAGVILPVVLTIGAASGDATASLAIQDSGINVSGTDLAISAPLSLAASQTWDVGAITYTDAAGAVQSTQSLTVSGPLSLGANALTLTGGGNVTVSGAITGTAGITLDSNYTGTVTLKSTASTYSGGTTVNGGALVVSSYDQIDNGAITNNGTIQFNLTAPLSLTGSDVGTGGVTNSGTGVVTLTGVNTYGGTTTVSGGTLVLGTTTALPSGGTVVNNATLDVNANTTAGNISGTSGHLNIGSVNSGGTVTAVATLTLASNSGISTQATVTINSGSTLDITNNGLLINYGTGTDPVSTIVADLTTSFNSNWAGTGLTSSTAASDPGNGTIGYIDGATDTLSSIGGTNALLIRYTIPGDTNLDGQVNFADLLTIAQHFGSIGNDYFNGDLNYDATGIVNFSDLLLVAQHFGQALTGAEATQLGGSFASQWNLALAEVGKTDMAVPSVPEPGSVGLVLLGAAGLLSRRRRRQQAK
jgi:autotransporter-associated beta strand protein